MSVWKRACLYVTRNKKRSVLSFLLYTVLVLFLLVELVFLKMSDSAIRELRQSIGGYFTVQTGADSEEYTDEKLLSNIEATEHVKTVNGIDYFYLYNQETNLFPGAYYKSGNVLEHVPKYVACTDSSLHERFLFTSFVLIDGRHISPEDEGKAVISKEVAEYNNLSVGDMIDASVVEGVPGWMEDAYGTKVQFEVVGIFSATKTEVIKPGTPEHGLQENMIFVDIHTAKQLFDLKFKNLGIDEYRYGSGFMVFVDDPEQIGSVIEDLTSHDYTDWDNFIISENSVRYQEVLGPITKARSISSILFLITCVISITVITLTLILWTRDRMSEIGVLVALGFSKMQIIRQIILENCILAIPSLGIGAVGVLIAIKYMSQLFGGLLVGFTLSIGQFLVLLAGTVMIIIVTVFIVMIFLIDKHPKKILSALG